MHSAKDVPGELPDGLAIVGVPERADPRDALCGATSLDALPEGAVVGTASLRRRSQLLAAAPGSRRRASCAATWTPACERLARATYDAIVLAQAGLDRLGRGGEGEPLDAAAAARRRARAASRWRRARRRATRELPPRR